jgi:hypothetical protein
VQYYHGKSSIQQEGSFHQQIGYKLKEETSEVYIWITALCGAGAWTLRTVYRKYLASFEMWCWRRMEKIIWIDRVGNEVLHRVKEERNIQHTVKKEEG